jgi:hypothetical protein
MPALHSVFFSLNFQAKIVYCSCLSHSIFRATAIQFSSLSLHFLFLKEFIYYEIQLFSIGATLYFHLLVYFNISLTAIHFAAN